ncbi:immunity 42 family protein [Rosenbergiella nectarea]|uniref:immunity 42 family protein n=1 Tax=Rosenbergiella nectarea TaxID=988801 RepID=UPI001BDB6486|nr:immunity 42 family protein [Rosenbergiella nectarea]MBT0731510.1 hypothetical protein [Rosenbergiella nectarea subsp. apis]
MIYGDPFYFSLQFDVVETWNFPDDIWKNGVFSLYIDGKRIFDTIEAFELKTIFSFYLKSPINELCINDIDISSADLYKNAESYFTGDGEILIDGLFDLTCTAMEDNGCYLYFIKTRSHDRLVWSIDNGENVNETLLPLGTIIDVINKLDKEVF